MSRPPKVGALFAGYGGIELALHDVLGAEPAWFSEFDTAPSKILEHRYPGVPNHGDVTKIDWATVEPVDIITGGSPCQDLSHAGKRAGMKAGTRSGLWASMCDAIDILRPSLVVWENVRGALSAEADSTVERCGFCVDDRGGPSLRALGRVLGDLAELGYDCAWTSLRAADVGAPHGRFRVFVLAWTADSDLTGLERREPAPGRVVSSGGAGVAVWGSREWRDLTLLRTPTAQLAVNGGSQHPDKRKAGGHGPTLADEVETHLLPTPRATDGTKGGPNQRGSSGDLMLPSAVRTEFGQYAPAIARWEALTRPAPSPTEPTGKGGAHRLSPRFVEWMMGLPAGWVTDVPGITRNDQLKALGNGVVPQQCAAAIRQLLRIRQSVADRTAA
jgi:DNA (cytosine-5)-methyltransferase 1